MLHLKLRLLAGDRGLPPPSKRQIEARVRSCVALFLRGWLFLRGCQAGAKGYVGGFRWGSCRQRAFRLRPRDLNLGTAGDDVVVASRR
ncbi:MAG: hypothetical protein KGI99_06440 [Bradyrhizobium sp.]|uniref:hypothetical protein n=1 Tax=Bradyrhizobium sp. TaxID=376 RepID=UPI00238D5E30|nr:hypothetical protein [Bradyrhizobium sp.]MDE2066852.1 hypothetical protein [Bradyrhizobium sp.]